MWPVKMLAMPNKKPNITKPRYKAGRRLIIHLPSKLMAIMIKKNDQIAWCARKYRTEETICIGD